MNIIDVIELPPPHRERAIPAVPVHRAITAAAAQMPAVPKADENEQQGFMFRSIERIMTAARRVLAANGVLPVPTVRERTVEVILVGRNQNPWRLVSLTVDWTITGPLGDSMAATTIGEGFDPGDKAASKAMTMAWKSLLLVLLQIADGYDDTDADDQPRPEPSGRAEGEPDDGRRRTTGPPVGPRRASRRPAAPAAPSGPDPAYVAPPAPEGGECPGAELARVFGVKSGQVLIDARKKADLLGVTMPSKLLDVDQVVAEHLATDYMTAQAAAAEAIAAENGSAS